jgi:hypothetical protein
MMPLKTVDFKAVAVVDTGWRIYILQVYLNIYIYIHIHIYI